MDWLAIIWMPAACVGVLVCVYALVAWLDRDGDDLS